jgi:hypothetical protein
MTESLCGNCSVCCKIPSIPEINKPSNTWCHHYAKGVGCSIYQDRPQVCRDFKCYWLQGVLAGYSKNQTGPRPDKSKVFVLEFERDGRVVIQLIAYSPLHPRALEAPGYKNWIKSALDAGSVVETIKILGTGQWQKAVLDKRPG